MSKIIGAVEIGTSSAKALVGEVGETGALSIVGMATRQNEGMRKGEIMDFEVQPLRCAFQELKMSEPQLTDLSSTNRSPSERANAPRFASVVTSITE